jgi:hypothetical protein
MQTTETTKEPRKKHSHRCKSCGYAVYCYKSQCQEPQRVAACNICQSNQNRAARS